MNRMKLEFTPHGVLQAYQHGIFPMGRAGSSYIHWYQPDPRAVLPLDNFHLSKSLARSIRRKRFEMKINTDFVGVMKACAKRDEDEIWITKDFIEVYCALHLLGYAHSLEIYIDEQMVGGLYGIAIGGAFMAESMFHNVTDASKAAVYELVNHLNDNGFTLLDVQYLTPHLASLGVVEILLFEYIAKLNEAVKLPCRFDL